MEWRVGIGYDIHPLKEKRRLILGGIHIPYPRGLVGHSDADVVLHAIMDALLGAAGEKDIGELFPDNKPEYKAISSKELLKKVREKLSSKGFLINNIDIVIITKEPKISSYKDKIRQSIAQVLKIKKDRINLKAKTNQGIGETGRSKAIASFAIAGLIKKE